MSWPIDSRLLFTLLVGVVALQRLVELRLARRHTERALAAGGREYGRGHYPVMVVLHGAFLFACLAEVWLVGRPFRPALAAAMLGVLVLAGALRFWVIATLGERWTTRVIWVPGRTLARDGPYRFLRHPNYLAVALEIVALPLVHGAWWTAALFTVANALLLRHRIGVEESALERETGTARSLPAGGPTEGMRP